MLVAIKMKNEQTLRMKKKLEEYLSNQNVCNDESTKDIVEETPSILLTKLHNGDISAVKVLNAFQFKALQVTDKINCIAEFIPEAQQWAERCDRIPIEDRQPLHGLPMSIKESSGVQGMDATLGLAKYLFDPMSKHSNIVEILLQNGAVPFCKTNLPQCGISFCCSNPIYGETSNPHDPLRTPGGSSGGEAALIASGGSIAGIGSDLAGSIRVPASMSGCFGFKFSSNRISAAGCRTALKGMIGVFSCAGVLGRDAFILGLVTKVLAESIELNLEDVSIARVPWNEDLFTSDRKLTFGYFIDSSFFPSSPGVKRALNEAKDALTKAGHNVIPFEMISPEIIVEEAFKLITADTGAYIKKQFYGERMDSSVRLNLFVALATGLKRKIIEAFLCYRSSVQSVVIKSNCWTVEKLWKTLNKRQGIVQEVKDRMRRARVDLLLSPAHPIPAPHHHVPAVMMCSALYTVIANYCNFPSGAVPVTNETERDQALLDDYPDTEYLLRMAKETTRGAVGLPLGVLLTALPYQEEMVLKGMLELEKALVLK